MGRGLVAMTTRRVYPHLTVIGTVVILPAILALSPVLTAQNSGRPVLVAIFAHPDDEIVVGPMLSRYAREGADVRLVLATNGDRGTRITKIPAGEALGRARAQEAMCSARYAARARCGLSSNRPTVEWVHLSASGLCAGGAPRHFLSLTRGARAAAGHTFLWARVSLAIDIGRWHRRRGWRKAS